MRVAPRQNRVRKQAWLNIALRITLLSWLVAVATLAIFVMVTIPQQKKTFLTNLESKANGLAVSLHDVAAGAAINEDYASVVSAAQTLLAGDPDLEFLVVMKNDGFSLVIEQNSWRVENSVAPFWYERERKSAGGIETVPMFDKRVFHFSQPFDYSGIQWGWIHVGLSLQGYDRSVAELYRNTVVLAIGCIVFSLLISLLYARQIVRPIVRLRYLFQQIAGGDLSVRADASRRDELGGLADSVNIMTEALLRRDRILESVRFAAQQFLQSSHWEDAIVDVLAQIGQAAVASRASVFRNSRDDNGELGVSQLFSWTSEHVPQELATSHLENAYYGRRGFTEWVLTLEKNEAVTRAISTMNEAEKAFFTRRKVRSIIAIPIFVENRWWGFLEFDDRFEERIWTDAEKDSLRAGADMLGATIARQLVEDALLEAKNTLELRVEERTAELQKQVEAKEQALADLAAAQSSLVEMSRSAGMAEVATGVLHNVGNVLNSVNVSCTLLMDQLRDSRVANVARVAGLIQDQEKTLGYFFTEDPRGRQIPAYLSSLATALREEHQTMFREAESLSARIGHIKEIVAMQQSYGRVSGISEAIAPEQLMEDAVKLNSGALVRHGVAVVREYHPAPIIAVDKHKVLQILLNLINNAKYACSEKNTPEKKITLRISSTEPDWIRMEVADNGMGIASENLTRIFQHGFTTRKSGHGFGLHSGALAAHELGGSLTVHSDGPGCGAVFTLLLPRVSKEKQ